MSSLKMMLRNFKSAKGDGGAGAATFVGGARAAAFVCGAEISELLDAACAGASDCGDPTKFVRTTMLVLTLMSCFRGTGFADVFDFSADAAVDSPPAV